LQLGGKRRDRRPHPHRNRQNALGVSWKRLLGRKRGRFGQHGSVRENVQSTEYTRLN